MLGKGRKRIGVGGAGVCVRARVWVGGHIRHSKEPRQGLGCSGGIKPWLRGKPTNAKYFNVSVVDGWMEWERKARTDPVSRIIHEEVEEHG